MNTILEAKAVNKIFPIKKMFKKTLHLKALSDINFTLGPNETLGIVGESGCASSGYSFSRASNCFNFMSKS